MLILTRKANESIVINDNIKVTVVEIRGDKVRLGVVAPKEIPVHRQEVYDVIIQPRESTKVAAPLQGSEQSLDRIMAKMAGSPSQSEVIQAMSEAIEEANLDAESPSDLKAKLLERLDR